MNINEEKKGEIVIMGIDGRLDATTYGELETKLLARIDSGEKLLLFDLSSLSYISSAGLRVFLMGAKKLSKVQGKLALCALQEQVKEVFDIAGFSSFFPIFASRDEALQSLS